MTVEVRTPPAQHVVDVRYVGPYAGCRGDLCLPVRPL